MCKFPVPHILTSTWCYQHLHLKFANFRVLGLLFKFHFSGYCLSWILCPYPLLIFLLDYLFVIDFSNFWIYSGHKVFVAICYKCLFSSWGMFLVLFKVFSLRRYFNCNIFKCVNFLKLMKTLYLIWEILL